MIGRTCRLETENPKTGDRATYVAAKIVGRDERSITVSYKVGDWDRHGNLCSMYTCRDTIPATHIRSLELK